MITQEQLKDLQQRKEDLKRYLDIDGKKIEVEEEELRTHVPDFWQDQKAAEAQMKKIKSLRNWINGCEEVELAVDEVATGFDFVKEGLIEEKDVDELYTKALAMLEKLELRNMLRHDEDKMDAILKINSGAGGTESQDWASMLMRMYLRWCERHGYKTAIEHIIDGDEAGIKSVTISIEGDFAYGYLKSENGVHRLVRVSPFDASGRRHTSFASVEVMPEFTDDGSIEINEADLEITTHKSSGAGGQHINKTESAVRIVHIPTGIVVGCQTERSQLQNKETALKMLKSKLMEIKLREKLDKIEDIKGVKMNIEWGAQIRSYVFMPYTLAKDTRTGYEDGNIQAVMDGEIDGFINAYLKMNAAQA
jgi:peptide chain release factor 2